MSGAPLVSSRVLSGSLPMPELGFGTAQFGNLYERTSAEECEAAVSEALSSGIRYFDSAPHYGLGLAESRLGASLRGRKRADFLVSTKVGRLLVDSPETSDRLDPEGFLVPADKRRVWDFSRDGVYRSLEGSLRRLGLNTVDIVFVHDPDEHMEEALNSALPALVELREAGVVSAIGVGMNHAGSLAQIIERFEVDIVMCAGRLTLLDDSARAELLPAAEARGVGVVAAGIYNSGILSMSNPGPDSYFHYDAVPLDVLRRTREIERVCESFGVSLPEAAVQYTLMYSSVVSAVVGMRSASHVRELVDRYCKEIPDALWSQLGHGGLKASRPVGG